MADLWRDFWIRETGTGQQVAQLHDIYDDDDDDDDDNEQEAAVFTFLFLIQITEFLVAVLYEQRLFTEWLLNEFGRVRKVAVVA